MNIQQPSVLSEEIMRWLSQFDNPQEAYLAVCVCCPWGTYKTYKGGEFSVGTRLIGGGYEVFVDLEIVDYDDQAGRQWQISFDQMREAFGAGHLSTQCRVSGDPEVDQSV